MRAPRDYGYGHTLELLMHHLAPGNCVLRRKRAAAAAAAAMGGILGENEKWMRGEHLHSAGGCQQSFSAWRGPGSPCR